MLNKTTVPFEQTTVEGINQTQGQQQQGNQSSGPIGKIGETITGAFK